MINWSDPDCNVTDHFTVGDCIWLPHWRRLANETDGFDKSMESEILQTCEMAEEIRAIVNCPMRVTSMFRPKTYSPLVGGNEHDVHTKGLAIDFTTVPTIAIDAAKSLLRPHLAALNIRMEKGTPTWIHIDRREVGPSGREFTA